MTESVRSVGKLNSVAILLSDREIWNCTDTKNYDSLS